MKKSGLATWWYLQTRTKCGLNHLMQICRHLNLKIPLWNCNSITIIQQHLNIMRSTYKLLTSDFVELDMIFLGHTGGFHQEPKDQKQPGHCTVAFLGGFEGSNGLTDQISQSNVQGRSCQVLQSRMSAICKLIA